MRYIALDTETTGLNVDSGHKLIEIGCLEIVDRALTGKKFHKFINPEREIEETATKIHGMRWSDLRKYPIFKDIADEFCEFVKDSILIIHNSKFDMGFLNAELSYCGKPDLEKHVKDVIDSLGLARNLHPGKKNSLDVLCSRYNIDNSERTLHGALLDSSLLAKVYLSMTRGQEKLNIQDKFNDKFSLPIKQNSDQKKICINKASDQEINTHKNYLKKMEKDCAGNVLWKCD
jgi:DNA polymerase-3 subunit epsilon